MRDEKSLRKEQATRERRRNEILDAAFKVLIIKGYRDTSMLAVAREASASKETLYAWFGDKHGLFSALIHRNAENVRDELAINLAKNPLPSEGLTRFGQTLLKLLLGSAATALNRAAISEAVKDTTFSHLIVSAGRDNTLPVLKSYLENQSDLNHLKFDDIDEAISTLIGLLLSDSQNLRLLGVMREPDEAWIAQRTEVAISNFLKLFAVNEA